jgi:hypothetical protein
VAQSSRKSEAHPDDTIYIYIYIYIYVYIYIYIYRARTQNSTDNANNVHCNKKSRKWIQLQYNLLAMPGKLEYRPGAHVVQKADAVLRRDKDRIQMTMI